MIKRVDPKRTIIEVEDFGRRPTSKFDISAILHLMKSCKKDFVEIGTWYGKTTYEVATRHPEKTIYTMDYMGEDLDLSDHEYKTRVPNIKELGAYGIHLENVTYIYANSHTYDFDQFVNVDFFFIDGDHSFSGVKIDSEKAIAYLKKNGGGTIAWHDVHTKNLTQVPEYMAHLAKTKVIYYIDNTNIGFITV